LRYAVVFIEITQLCNLCIADTSMAIALTTSIAQSSLRITVCIVVSLRAHPEMPIIIDTGRPVAPRTIMEDV